MRNLCRLNYRKETAKKKNKYHEKIKILHCTCDKYANEKTNITAKRDKNYVKNYRKSFERRTQISLLYVDKAVENAFY